MASHCPVDSDLTNLAIYSIISYKSLNLIHSNIHSMKLDDFIKEKNISYYQITQGMGKDPTAFHNHIKKKVLGEKTMTREEFIQLVQVVSKLTQTELTTSQVDYEVERVKLK